MRVTATVWAAIIAVFGASLFIEAQERPSIAERFPCEDPADLSRLQGKPIEDLRLWKSNVRTLAPLKDATQVA